MLQAPDRTSPEFSPVLRLALSFAAPGLFHLRAGQRVSGWVLMVLHWAGVLLGTTIVNGQYGSPWTVLVLWLVWQTLLAHWAHEDCCPSPLRRMPALLLVVLLAVLPLVLAGILVSRHHRIVAVPAMALEPGREGSLWLWAGTCCTPDCAGDGDLILLSNADNGGSHLTRVVSHSTTGDPGDSSVDCTSPHALRSGSMGTHGGDVGGLWHAQAAKTGSQLHIVWTRTPEPEPVPIPDLPAEHLFVSADVPLPDSQDGTPAVVTRDRCLGRATHILWADDLSLVGRRL
jgi:hypothetical protein